MSIPESFAATTIFVLQVSEHRAITGINHMSLTETTKNRTAIRRHFDVKEHVNLMST